MPKGLWALVLLAMIGLPALAAELPDSVAIHNPKDLEATLEKVEDAALAAGAPRHAVYGSTEKLVNFIEDSVLSTGRTVKLHPNLIKEDLVSFAGQGMDKAAIGSKLVQLMKSSKL